jgi:aromatic ring-opening dioxygenase LigB subunit
MALVAAALLPHPKGALDGFPKTVTGLAAAKKLFSQKKVERLIVVSSRVLTPSHAFAQTATDPAAYYILGLDKIQLTDSGEGSAVFENDLTFVEGAKERARPFGLPIKTSPTIKLDGGSSHAVTQLGLTTPVKLISIILPYKAPKELFEFGHLLGAFAQQSRENFGILAAGNLSARLSKESSAGFDPAGAQYDELIQSAAKTNDFKPVLSADIAMLEKAGQDSANSVAVLGAATMNILKSSLASYEVVGGVGHAVLTWS